MAQEHRKDKRVKEDFSILYRIYQRTEPEGTISKISDISKSGLCLITGTPLKTSDIMQITLRIPSDFEDKIDIFGRMVKSEKISATEYKVHISFIDVPAKIKHALECMVARIHLQQRTEQKNK